MLWHAEAIFVEYIMLLLKKKTGRQIAICLTFRIEVDGARI